MLSGEPTSDGWIPLKKRQWCGTRIHVKTSSCVLCNFIQHTMKISSHRLQEYDSAMWVFITWYSGLLPVKVNFMTNIMLDLLFLIPCNDLAYDIIDNEIKLEYRHQSFVNWISTGRGFVQGSWIKMEKRHAPISFITLFYKKQNES